MNGLALCAGIGGLEIGIKRAIPGYRTVCYVERNSFAASLLVERMGEKAMDKAPIWDDITTFNGVPWSEVIHCISAGFPCQPFSAAGDLTGKDHEAYIWPHIARIIKEIAPKFIFLENVPGIVSLGISDVLNDLSKMGFHARWCCIPVSKLGAVHIRERFFLFAYADGIRLPTWKNTSKQATEALDGVLESFGRNWWNAEPSVSRVAPRVSEYVDAVHCLGNAVVPAQAELAFRILMEGLLERDGNE